ncbi:hypothetical protein [Conchiformibius kuhniae]|uniref:Uncharacterized protein n=1 Tax=Conchiformibius kuhniae TaxID=211502 RepID=A0A8T9MW15_9NEIS|nr:hypothetical protein [Conchiformibius kuhniae]UOP05449.1 hypothetical protein LVJ77_04640 [Conchiformibius kuhniae]
MFTWLALGCLAACASEPYYFWEKQGVSQAKTRDVLGFCRQDVGADRLAKAQAEKLVGYCMRSKGFVLKQGYR